MGQELCGLDSADRVSYQAPEFLALFVGNRGAQILNLDHSLADENDLSVTQLDGQLGKRMSRGH